MPRARSDKTELRILKAEQAKLKSLVNILTDENNKNLRRALNAERELADWKGRFDSLLKMKGKSDG